jgi:hypothetical protein
MVLRFSMWPLISRGFRQLIDALVLPDHPSSNIPNIDSYVRTVEKMGKPLRLRHPRSRLYSLLAISIRVSSLIQQRRLLRRRLRPQQSLRGPWLLHLVSPPPSPYPQLHHPSQSHISNLLVPSLFFCLTSAMSVYGVIYFRREGVLPGASRIPSNSAMIDPDREAFSTAPHDDEYAPVHANDKDPDDMHHEMDGGEGSSVPYDPTSYAGGAGTSYVGAGAGRGAGRVVYAPPTVSDVGTAYRRYGEDDLEVGGYEEGEPGRVRFPAGNYN